MFCPNCGRQLPDDAQFCGNCGTPVETPPEIDIRNCPNCGNELADDAVFCGSCGAAVEQTPEATTETEPEVMAAPADPEINIRHCPICGGELADDAVFCGSCGAAAEQTTETKVELKPEVMPEPAEPEIEVRRCPNCGNELAEDAAFCGNCGTSLVDKPTPAIAIEPEQPVYAEAPETPEYVPEQTLAVENAAEATSTEPTDSLPTMETAVEQSKSNNKKPLIIAIVCIIVVIAIAAAVMLLGKSADKQEDTPPPDTNTPNSTNQQEEPKQQTIKKDFDFQNLGERFQWTDYIDTVKYINFTTINNDYTSVYQDILLKYVQILTNDDIYEELDSAGFNYQLADYDVEDVGYVIFDLNNDNIPELIISLFGEYNADEGLILDMYTIQDETLTQLLQGGERDRYYLCHDFVISNEGSNSAFESSLSYYEYLPGDSSLTLKEQIIYESEYDEENPCLYRTLENPTPQPISNEMADTIKATYKNMKLELTPLQDNASNGYGSEYILPGSDSRYIDESELYGLSAAECRLARNELYARHGRKFNSADLQNYFNAQSWYSPTVEADAFSDSMFNEYEKANRDLIMAYEKAQGYN